MPEHDSYFIDYKDVVSQYGRVLYQGKGIDDCLLWIRRRMDSEHFWPDIYYINDHGNIDLLDYDGNIVESWV